MKKNNKNNSDLEQDNEGSSWSEKMEGIASGFIHGMVGGIIDRAKEKIHELILKIQKGLVGSVMLVVGFIFIFIGFAIFINDLVGISDGIGYAVVGIVALLLGLIIIKK